MKAMLLEAASHTLVPTEVSVPEPKEEELLLKVSACGVCRTDLHVVDGELVHPRHHVIPGHEIVGTVVAAGPGATRFAIGQRIGVPWLGRTCGHCIYCCSGRENLCDQAQFTGYTLDGGYAQYAVAHQSYCFALPDGYGDAEAAPLLCAGLIGYRSLMAAGEAQRLGIYGFGAAAHIVSQIARVQGREVYAFTRPGDTEGQQFARDLGVEWAGDSNEPPPELLDAAIIFAPVGALVPEALKRTAKGGIVVCAGIHMSEIPAFSYDLLWGERTVRSIANLTRRDGEKFFKLAWKAGVHTSVQCYPLAQANEALEDVRQGRVRGAAVLIP